MDKDFWKPYEPALHRIMGGIAMLTNTRWLWLERREREQLPPRNDRHPVLYVRPRRSGKYWQGTTLREEHTNCSDIREYWPKPRVMDSFNDMREYDQGGTFTWPLLVGFCIGIGIAIGRMT